MNPAGDLTITAHGDREIVMTRSFAAPRQLVFDAFTKPELLKRWLGVWNGWELAECDVDLRVGGAYRWLWRGPGGREMGAGGIYREIRPPERIVSTERFDDPWYEGEAVGTIELVERGGRTIMTHTMRYASRAARDGVLRSPMETGLQASYAMLDTVLGATAGTR
jgi:uncharacterized protein YndB with AHSA1/START domain